MARVNIKPGRLSNRPVHEPAATTVFGEKWELDRLVSACLLGEKQFYVDGIDIEHRIRELADKVDPEHVAQLAVHARRELGLRHAPLLLLCALTNRNAGLGPLVRATARDVLRTPRDAMDLIALYWGGPSRSKPLPNAFKSAIRDGFARWTAFQLRRYGTMTNVGVRLRDLMMLAHPMARTKLGELFTEIATNKIEPPETWESVLPRLTNEGRRGFWTAMLRDGKLGALALVRNLRNFEQDGVDHAVVVDALGKCNAADVWPWQAINAARVVPAYADALGALVLRCIAALPPLPGKTGILVDVSGSMKDKLSAHGENTRMDAAAGLAVVLRGMSDDAHVATFSDRLVELVTDGVNGLRLANAIVQSQMHGGTNLGPAVEEFATRHRFDRLVVVTDEQAQYAVVWPHGVRNYIINVASYQRGVDGSGEVVRINGWSGGVVRFITDFEGIAGPLVTADESLSDA